MALICDWSAITRQATRYSSQKLTTTTTSLSPSTMVRGFTDLVVQ